ncbi:MAG: hypothetical protein ACK52S_07060 [Pirellula sp.]|jgi:hypothetical protein
MPIRVICQCGQTLNVPDNLAGKGVKCPKCQGAVRVPAATGSGSVGASGAKAGATSASAGKPTAPGKPAAASKGAGKGAGGADALSSLFDQAGLTKREGVFCPSCDKSLPPGTAICVSCGFHLEQGAKVEGFQVDVKEFGDKRLIEAAEMMKREAETDKRLLGAGMPWWMMLALVIGILFMMGAIAMKMDYGTSGNYSSVAMIAKFQRATYYAVFAFSLGGAAALVALFSYLGIAFGAFKETLKEGLLCLFAPLYIVYYMFSRMQARKLTNIVIIFWVSVIIAAVCLGYSLPKI